MVMPLVDRMCWPKGHGPIGSDPPGLSLAQDRRSSPMGLSLA